MTIKEYKEKIITKSLPPVLVLLGNDRWIKYHWVEKIHNAYGGEKIYCEKILEFDKRIRTINLAGNVINVGVIIIDDLLKQLSQNDINKAKEFCFDNKVLILFCEQPINEFECIYLEPTPRQTKKYLKENITRKICDKNLEYLIDLYDNNVSRILIELDKLLIIEESNEMFEEFVTTGSFTKEIDITETQLIEAFLQRNNKGCSSLLSYIDIKFSLIFNFINAIERVFLVQATQNPSRENTGLVPNNILYYQKFCGKFTDRELIEMYLYLISCYKRLKEIAVYDKCPFEKNSGTQIAIVQFICKYI